MRLICPNCGAQYEIDAALLPEGGRDVQCSACGHTWFQHPDTLEADLADELGVTAPAEPRAEAAAPPSRPAPELEHVSEPEPDDAPEPELQAPPPERRRPRRPDEAALAILREEAEREAEVRRREAAGMETQGELGLDDLPVRPRAAAQPSLEELAATVSAAVTPEPEPDPAPEPEGQAADRQRPADRRALFPDIDEINSSLAGGSAEPVTPVAAERAETERRQRRRGFRIGFLTVVTFASLLIVLYAYAPRLAETFPEARPYLADYVAWANLKRLQIDGLMQSAIALIGG
jgi:predicted Zn finger-like uncharacterized protein